MSSEGTPNSPKPKQKSTRTTGVVEFNAITLVKSGIEQQQERDVTRAHLAVAI